MKKIMNNVDAVENEMVLGMVKAYPQYIKKLDCGNVVVRARKKEGKVGKRLHIGFDDPSHATGTPEFIETEFRRVRDEIKNPFADKANFSIIQCFARERA